MSRHTDLMYALERTGHGQMLCHGNSMMPVLTNPSYCAYDRQGKYAVGDIVFCKVRGRFIDAHRITKVRADGAYLIANNKGRENGWTHQVYGKVVAAQDRNGDTIYRDDPVRSTDPASAA